MEKMTRALTIAGFDGSAGAGLVADVMTMAHFGVYGEAVCTALTEQNENEHPGIDEAHYTSLLDAIIWRDTATSTSTTPQSRNGGKYSR